MFPRIVAVLAVLVIAGCAGTASIPPDAGLPPPSDGSPPSSGTASTPLGSPFSERERSKTWVGDPLLIDRQDLRLGTTVQYHRVPNASELHDLTLLPGLSRLVLSFEGWPEYSAIQALNQTPEGIELVVVLQGWPPTRAAIDAWNYISMPTRAIVVVAGPPGSIDQVTNLNAMRALERVIAVMDDPSRTGFERLQRPLSFRKLVE